MIKQFRYFDYGEITHDLTTNTAEEFRTGTAFSSENLIGKQLIAFGIQAPRGTEIFLSSEALPENWLDGENKIIINASGLYQINFNSADMAFELGGLAVNVKDDHNYRDYGIIVDIIYKDKEQIPEEEVIENE